MQGIADELRRPAFLRGDGHGSALCHVQLWTRLARPPRANDGWSIELLIASSLPLHQIVQMPRGSLVRQWVEHAGTGLKVSCPAAVSGCDVRAGQRAIRLLS
jgi:hypothetical protein